MGSDALWWSAKGLPVKSHQASLFSQTEQELWGSTAEASLLPSHQESRATRREQQQSCVSDRATHNGQQQNER